MDIKVPKKDISLKSDGSAASCVAKSSAQRTWVAPTKCTSRG